jgi:DNA-binding CsgD family transcriptional regulator
MHLSTREATPDDFGQMMRLCHPEPNPDIARLRHEWDILWAHASMMTLLVEDRDLPKDRRALSLMGAIFVRDRFLQESISARQPFAVSRLVAELEEGERHLLSDTELGMQNARDGVVMFVLFLAWQPNGHEHIREETLRSLLVNGFAERFQGNNIKWIVGETAGTIHREIALRTGCEVLNSYAQYNSRPEAEASSFQPALVGVSRDGGMKMENYWFHRMFTYMTPQFCFTDSQRQVLLLARHGLTDVEIAADLAVTPDAVKKRWTAIYERVDAVMPGLLPESPSGSRGAEKKRALLAYLRDRTEELRPFERRAQEAISSARG